MSPLSETPILARLRWPGREPLPVEPGPTRAVLARTFLYLFGAGGTLAVGSLLLPHSGLRNDLFVALPGIAAWGVALLMLVAFDRVPMWFFRLLPGLGTILASTVVWAGGPSAIPYAGFYFWVVLSSFYLFEARWAWINVAFVMSAFTLVLIVTPELPNRAITWVMVTGALAVGGAMIGLLRARLEHLLLQLSEALERTRRSEQALAEDIIERKLQEERLQRTLRRLAATTDVALALGREMELEGLLRLIAERTRALLGAGGVAIFVAESGTMRRAAVAGDESAVPLDVEDHGPDALVAPLDFRGQSHGVLVVAGHGGFSSDDESTLRAFAASAATAVAAAKSVKQDILARSIEASERERRRWARELHDQTLQGLGVLQMRLEAALPAGPQALDAAARVALDQIRSEIENLRRVIADLRPALLDDFGLAPAIQALCERVSESYGLRVARTIDIGDHGDGRLGPELEQTIYRLVQEALANVCKHAEAQVAIVEVLAEGNTVTVRVDDDGHGFGTGDWSEGFGLAGMRERVRLADGRLRVESSSRGTHVEAVLPLAPVAVATA